MLLVKGKNEIFIGKYNCNVPLKARATLFNIVRILDYYQGALENLLIKKTIMDDNVKSVFTHVTGGHIGVPKQ